MGVDQINISNLTSLEELQHVVDQEDVVLVYFSHEQCNVCKVLKPKIAELLASDYPRIKMSYADTVKHPEIAAQHSIFAVPTILIFFAGKESIRKSRTIGIDEPDCSGIHRNFRFCIIQSFNAIPESLIGCLVQLHRDKSC